MKTFLLSLLLLTTSAFAVSDSIRILTPQAIRDLLGSYPALGSEASHGDFDTLLQVQNTRTPEECEKAALEEDASIETMFSGSAGPLTKNQLRLAKIQILQYYPEIGANIALAKRLFKRPRPYLTDSALTPCIEKESSYAYPSGHAALAHYMAHKISQIFPKKKSALLKRAEEVSWNRVLGGVHHPSDIAAGKKLGLELADE